ncbi:MAG: hypothetical protein IT176_05840 [Acidobacteria bacterium]|nr:hypothetical protein [Acidobacteriota bacterium]
MQPRTRRWLVRAAWAVGALVAIAAALAGYVYSLLPEPIGDPPTLQTQLFEKPAQPLPVSGRYVGKSATELAALIKSRQATSTEIVREHLHHIRNTNHRTNAFVWLFESQALAAAAEADRKVARGEPLGRLHGVPVGVKEQFGIEGQPQTVNATMFQGFRAARNSLAVDAWLAEGAIVVGTTNVSRLLFDFQTFGEIYPTALNPYDPARTPGGSTGGGAAAVASGLVPLELGGDMGGSIRVPAAFCGIYGLKTTEGAMGLDPQSFPGVPGTLRYKRMAVSGPLARNVDDLELAWNALMSRWPEGGARMLEPKASLRDYRVAHLDEWAFGNDRVRVAGDVKAGLKALIDRLGAHGVITTPAQPGDFEAMVAMHRMLSSYMAFEKVPALFRRLMAHRLRSQDEGRFDYRETFDRLADLDPARYDDLLQRRDALTRRLEAFFADHDLLILPVATGPAIAHNPQHLPIDVDGRPVAYWDYFLLPIVFNATGHPALTVPLGLNAQGLPLAVQIVGPMYSERRLIAFARAIESLHTGWVAPPAK